MYTIYHIVFHQSYCRHFLEGAYPPVYFIVDSHLLEKYDNMISIKYIYSHLPLYILKNVEIFELWWDKNKSFTLLTALRANFCFQQVVNINTVCYLA